ncbi:MAG: hypothetical protein Q7S16_03005 [bacterium]|nr:hypothetical protein [bacterium]
MDWTCNAVRVFYELPLKWKLIAVFLILFVVAMVKVPIIRYIVVGVYSVSIAIFIACVVIGAFEMKKTYHQL